MSYEALTAYAAVGTFVVITATAIAALFQLCLPRMADLTREVTE